MKKAKAKVTALVLAAALPGVSALSCSTTVMREFRDAMLDGAATAIGAETANWVASWFPDPEEG